MTYSFFEVLLRFEDFINNRKQKQEMNKLSGAFFGIAGCNQLPKSIYSINYVNFSRFKRPGQDRETSWTCFVREKAYGDLTQNKEYLKKGPYMDVNYHQMMITKAHEPWESPDIMEKLQHDKERMKKHEVIS